MSKVFRLIVVSVAFWIVLNFVAVRQLSEADRDNARRVIRNSIAKLVSVRTSDRRPDQPLSDAKGDTLAANEEGNEIEPEDSASGSDSSNSGSGSGGATAAPVSTRHHDHHQHRHSAHGDSDAGPPKKRSSGGPAEDTTAKPPSSHPKKAKDPLPRSVGNSAHAAATSPVTIRADKVRFMVVGDWGGPGREPQRNVASSMSTIASSDPNHALHFVISTGDNMYEDGVSGVSDKKFKRNFENVYTQPSLQVRWYMSLGNHDHGAHGVIRDAQAEVNYTKLSSRWFLPSTYYSQTFHVAPHGRGDEHHSAFTLDLFVLDTYDYSPRVTQMTDDQLRWFEGSLKSSTADVKIVVGHRPLFSAGAKHGSSPYMQKKLEPFFIKYGVSAYLCGDDHELQLLQSKGVLHMLSGGGARAKKDLKPNGVPQTVFQAGVHGFMFAAVNRSHMEVEVYNMHGEKLHSLAHPTLSTAR